MRRLVLKITLCSVMMFALAVDVGEAHAALVVYGTRSDFDAAVSNQQTITFEGLAPAGGAINYGGDLDVQGVSFHTATGSLAVSDPGVVFGLYTSGSGAAFDALESGDTKILLQPHTTAVGFDLALFFNTTAHILLRDAEGNSREVNVTGTTPDVLGPRTPVFFGFATTSEFTMLEIQRSNFLVLDNFSTAVETSTVPEPTSVVLVAIGAIGTVCGSVYKRRKIVISQ